MKITKNGRPIHSVDEWFCLCSATNKRFENQWRDGKSEKELAKAWFPVPGEATVPRELCSLLNSLPDRLDSIELVEGEPEVIVNFDAIRNPRHCDCLVQGRCRLETVTISIEAKGHEPFSHTVRNALKMVRCKPSSEVPKRICLLTEALFGGGSIEESDDFRYQLLFGTAAALSAAKKHRATVAVFVVHEFVTALTKDARRKKNAADLESFVCALGKGLIPHVCAGQLFGPVRVPGNEYIPENVDLFIGKATQNTRP